MVWLHPVFCLCRDYTNPMLPVNQTAIDSALQVFGSYFIFSLFIYIYVFAYFHYMLTTYDVHSAIGPDEKRKELESNVLLATIENMQYAVTVEVLNTVRILFSH